MTDRIFLLGDDGNLIDMQARDYESEALLQELLAIHPVLLPAGGDEEDGVPWLLVTREATIPDDRGAVRLSVDHLFLDRDGVPTLVEVKRATDPRIRREVVGQMLDYAANAVTHWTVERIQAQVEVTCQKRNRAPEAVLVEFLGDDADLDEYWQTVKTNLQAGRIRMLFVADRIPPELRRVVEFLNNQMALAEVLAIEVLQYEGAGLKTLVPRVVGQSEVAREKKSSAIKRKWNEADFMEALREQDASNVQVAKEVLDWCVRHGFTIVWGKGSHSGSFVPQYTHNGKQHVSVALWTNGWVELQFQHMKHPPFTDEMMRRAFQQKLNQIEGVTIPDSRLSSRPSFPLDSLMTGPAMQQFLGTMEWFIEQVRSAEPEQE